MYTVYSKPNCPHCIYAKALLKQLGAPYHEIVLDIGQQKAEHVEYISRDAFFGKIPNAKTVPQIVHEDVLIGGFIELKKYLEALAPTTEHN